MAGAIDGAFMPTQVTLTGVGRILLNGQVAADGMQYHVAISRKAEPGDGGTHHIGGRLLSRFPVMLIGEDVELELQDGRRWACIIQSSHGSLKNVGGAIE
jgi:hypothetical protein